MLFALTSDDFFEAGAEAGVGALGLFLAVELFVDELWELGELFCWDWVGYDLMLQESINISFYLIL